jgi:putative transposase
MPPAPMHREMLLSQPQTPENHRHSGIGFHTPADVHYGRAELIREQRGQVLQAAYAAHPERFVRKVPTPPELPTVAGINRPEEAPTTAQ